jgi:multidrug efflux pump subunit AcrA (membrane-fusion protein)
MAPSFGGVKALTRPSRDSTMSFTFPVEIAEILVKGGQSVKKGDLLIRGRDDEARFQRDLQKLAADSDLEVQRAQAAVDQAQVEFDGQKEARGKGGGNKLDFARAETTLKVRQVELLIAKLNLESQQIQLGLRGAQYDRFYMRAPFDGRVDKVSCDVGEVKRETEDVVRVVATDPLWIEVTPRTHETLNLGTKPGDKAWVLLDVPGEAAVHVGKVVEVAADADFGADTRRVRVELANPSDFPSGITAWVRFTPPEGEWSARIAQPNQEKVAAARGGAAP